MPVDLSKWGPVTVLLVALAVLVAAGGLVVVIVEPSTLTFAQYLDDLKAFAVALGVLGVGRGIHIGLSNAGDAQARAAVATVGGDLQGSSEGVKADGFVPPGADALAEPDAPGQG